MQGVELSRRFYRDIVRPWLDASVPGLAHSAALMGYGSELLGFDDETSRDHNWGPRVQIFVSEDAFAAHGKQLVGAFLRDAPPSFEGEPIGYRSRPHAPIEGPGRAGDAGHGLEILTLEASLSDALGVASVGEITTAHWLGFAQQRLIAFTAGAVFQDDGGRLAEARQALAYFPRDIWLYRIAGRWRRIAEEQAFVGRTGQVGDDLGSRVIAARLVRDIMGMAFLLERQYAPYAKWFGSAFARLPLSAKLAPHLQEALGATDWRERGEALAAAYLVLAQRQGEDGIGGDVVPVVGPYHERPFATINADDLVAASLRQIEDPALRALPVVGSIDEVTDATPVLVDPLATQRMMEGLFE